MKTQTLLHRVRILPLGDSLTQGDGSPSSYRYHLFRLLSEAGIPFRVGGLAAHMYEQGDVSGGRALRKLS